MTDKEPATAMDETDLSSEPPRPERPQPTKVVRQVEQGLSGVGGLVVGAPMTIGFILLLWVVGAATGSLGSGPPPELLEQVGVGTKALADLQWWTPLSSALWCLNLAGYLVTTALLLMLGVPAERKLGRPRTAAVFVISQVLGSLVGVGLVKLGSLVGWTWLASLDTDSAVGPSVGVVGVGLALSCRLPVLWRRRLRLLLLVALLVLALYSGYLQDVLRLCGGVAGLLVGPPLLGRASRITLWAPSHSETRVLVAIVVAASALGPALVMLEPYQNGPLSVFSGVIASPQPDAELIGLTCADPDQVQYCQELRAAAGYDRFPGTIMALIPACFLLTVAEGLRRGRRLAWRAAMVVNLALVGLFIWAVVDFINSKEVVVGEDGTQISQAQLLVEGALPALLPLITIVVLLSARRHFQLLIPRRNALRLGLLILGTFLGLSAAYVGVGLLASADFTPVPTFGDLLADVPARFLPPGYLDLFPVRFTLESGLARVLFEYLGVVFWLVVLFALLAAFWRALPRQAQGDAARARALMVEHGGSTLAYLTTWRGNHYWFTADGTAMVAYRVVSTIALTTGDPVGASESRREALRGFAAYCVNNGWTPCFYSITESMRDAATEFGWNAVQVAEDTVVPLRELKFTGKKWQDVRTALNKAGKAGVTAEWWRYPEAPLAITDQVRSISEEWVADKGMPEMGFTLGGLEELADPEVRCLVALDPDRTVHGITSWLPVYRDGQIVGWTLDFMRRRASGFTGVMEFLIASAALSFQEEGAEFLSLSGAPLARLDRGEQPGGLQRLLDFTGRVLEPVYGFRSLLAFKAKFQPVYEPLFMAYPDPAVLPRIANAVGRAYLPDLSARQGWRLVGRVLKRNP